MSGPPPFPEAVLQSGPKTGSPLQIYVGVGQRQIILGHALVITVDGGDALEVDALHFADLLLDLAADVGIFA